MKSYGTAISLDWLANLFARHQRLLTVAVLAITALAAVGYIPNHPKWSDYAPSIDLNGMLHWAVTGWTSAPSQTSSPEPAPTPEPNSLPKPAPPPAPAPPRASRASEVSENFNLQRSEAFLVVECDNLFTPEAVTAIRHLVEKVEELPIVESMFWADRVPMLNVFGFADPLFPEEGSSRQAFTEAREKLLKHPLVAGQLLSPDGRTLMMPIVYDWIYLTKDEDCTTLIVATAQAAADESLAQAKLPPGEPRPQIKVGITGNVPLYLAQEQAFKHNQWLFRLVGFGMTTLLAVVLFRGLSAVIVVSTAPMLGLFWTFGLFAIFEVEINELTVAVLPVLISMVGFTDGVHLMVHIRSMRAAGMSKMEAVTETISKVGLACFLTSLTTAIGFVSLQQAESSFVRSFGFACGVGVVIAFFAVVTAVPLLSCTWLGKNIHSGHDHDIVGRNMRWFEGYIDWILKRRGLVTALGVSSTLVTALISTTLRPDAQLANTMPASAPAYQALAHCDEAFGGIEFVRVVIRWEDDVADDSPEILQSIKDVEEVFADEPLVQHPLSIRNMLATFPGDADDLSTQMTFLSLLPRDLKSFFFRDEANQAVVTLRIQDVGIATYEPIFERVNQRLADLQTRYTGFSFTLEGDPVSRTEDLTEIVSDLVNSLMMASLVIFAVLTVVYRSLRLGLIAVIPNMFPLTITGTMLVLAGKPLDIASVCSFVVCLGIAVDDTIHFLSRFQVEMSQERQLTAPNIQGAIRRSFLGVGTALIVTTVVLIAGFSTVLASDLQAHRTFAAMACSTIGAALFGDMIILPAMLALFTRSTRH